MIESDLVLIKPGAEVRLGGIPATVTALQVWDGLRVNYHVVWWDGRNRHAEWVDPCEIEAGAAATTRIGFQTN